jgi:hypothetical protein
MLFDLSRQIAKPPECPDCDIVMEFLASQRTKRVLVSTILERTLFLCPNCHRLSRRLLARRAPKLRQLILTHRIESDGVETFSR